MKTKIKPYLVNDQMYHVISKSISEFKIFNTKNDFLRMQRLFQFYQFKMNYRFSDFMLLRKVARERFENYFKRIAKNKKKSVQIIGYCIMPTHIHLIIKQLIKNGVSDYMKNLLNSYTRYFNIKHKRKGPLWEQRFKRILVESDEQLLHLTRYIHLNPITAQLVEKPEEWAFSSYNDYLHKNDFFLADYKGILEIDPDSYDKFVKDRISYQRNLAKIKKLLLD